MIVDSTPEIQLLDTGLTSPASLSNHSGSPTNSAKISPIKDGFAKNTQEDVEMSEPK